MKNIEIINGPNLNMLGHRETNIYGKEDYQSLCSHLREYAAQKGSGLNIFQSNHEGEIVDHIQNIFLNTKNDSLTGIIINAAAYTHTSIAIRDALTIHKAPIIEVHISDIKERENFRHFSFISDIASKEIIGKGTKGYFLAIDYLLNLK